MAEKMSAAVELWRHDDPQSTQMWKFLGHVNSKYSLKLKDYPTLYRWSVDNIAAFWEEVWDFTGITSSKRFDEVLPADAPMFPRPDFYGGSLLNFAENLLFPANAEVKDSDVAIITATEDEAALSETSWAQLRELVRQCTNAMRAAGVKENTVVAGFVANHATALVAILSSAALGAVWTGISPDNGVSAVLDRLVQIRPQILFADNATLYNGKRWSCTDKTVEIVEALQKHGLELVVVINGLNGVSMGLEEIQAKGLDAVDFGGWLKSAPNEPLAFKQLPPSHPLYVLYSSGTTGLPKAIVHTAAALAVGASLVLYSGSPFRPHGYLSIPRLLSSLRVTHFGTSAAYLTTLEANNVRPIDDPSLDLSALEAIYSTASPLPPSTFAFVYSAFPSCINLASITGGTDIISLFGAPCPLLPVRQGEIQCAGLGMAIGVIDSASPSDRPTLVVPADSPGDLVCMEAFPSQPLTFFGKDGEAKYRAAYFERFPGLWHHGDFVRVDPATGGLVMLGRSDGVLKPAGVRFGSAEIYNVLTRFFAAEVEDAVCVGRRRETDRDETVCLFVVMNESKAFDDDLRTRIKNVIRRELSPRHVPGVIEEAERGIPKTGNGKKIEVAVKQILSGMEVKTNASVANPEALEWFRGWSLKAN